MRKTSLQKLKKENLLFLKALVRNPRKTGALLPSSQALGDFFCQHIDFNASGYIVELGAGTGRLSKTLLNAGLSPERFVIVEYVEELCDYLRELFPEALVIHGNAWSLPSLLPPSCRGAVHTILSGIPMMNFSEAEKCDLLKTCSEVLTPAGQILQFTYGPISPLPRTYPGLKAKRLGLVLANFPPAYVWRYKKYIEIDLAPEYSQRMIYKMREKFLHVRARARRLYISQRTRLQRQKFFQKF